MAAFRETFDVHHHHGYILHAGTAANRTPTGPGDPRLTARAVTARTLTAAAHRHRAQPPAAPIPHAPRRARTPPRTHSAHAPPRTRRTLRRGPRQGVPCFHSAGHHRHSPLTEVSPGLCEAGPTLLGESEGPLCRVGVTPP
ncbi:hypothetical protein GCM10018963_08000 [Saccharothrix longispora]